MPTQILLKKQTSAPKAKSPGAVSAPRNPIAYRLDQFPWQTDLPVVDLCGIPIHALTEEQVIQHVMEQSKLGLGGWVVTPNLDHLRRLTHDAGYRSLCERATLTIADGMPLVWASRIQGTPLPERVAGSNLLSSLSAAAARQGRSVYLLGGAPGTAQQAAEVLQSKYPNLRIAGWYCPEIGVGMDELQIHNLANRLRQADPDIVYVALGSPKQEQLIDQLRGRVPRSWWLGIGIGFSFLSGRVKRAPLWMQKTGLEWLHRLVQEPQRLAKRYVVQGLPFAVSLFVGALAQRLGQRPAVIPAKAGIQSFRNGWIPPLRPGGMTSQKGVMRLVAAGDGFSSELNVVWPETQLPYEPVWRTEVIRGTFKRMLDVAVAAGLLAILSPLLVIIGVLIRLDSPGPIFFSQARVGKDGRLFKIWKFRSLYADAEARQMELASMNEMNGGVIFKIKNDPRVTRVGRYIRKASIDEIPQLWNVILGDMSLVGPRPPLPSEVDQYSPFQLRRLEVTPGLTCIWQVSGRSEVPFEKQVEMDVAYIKSQSLWLDITLLLKTIPAVLSGRGAY